MRRHLFFTLFVLLIPLLLGLACNEPEEIPGQRVPLGDVSMDYWAQMESPDDGLIMLDATDDVIVVASGTSIAASSDGGDSWELQAIGGISAFAIDEKNPKRIFAVQGKKLLVSQDGAASFTERQAPDSFVKVVPHPLLASDLLAISDTAFWRSGDLGVTWDLMFVPPDNPRLTALAVEESDTAYMYLVDAGGLRISSDGGKKWDSKTYFQEDSVTLLKTSSEGVFIGAGGFIRFSASHGEASSWLTYGPYFSTAPELADFLPVDDQTILYACFVQDPGEYEAYITRDLNAHWSNASPGLLGFHGSLTLARSEETYYALVTSGDGNFLYKFKDTELLP